MMDEAQTYYDGLVAQGHAPDQALQYTQQHYPGFQPAAAVATAPAPAPAPGPAFAAAPAPAPMAATAPIPAAPAAVAPQIQQIVVMQNSPKSMGVAMLLNFIWPGAGHMYLDYARGGLYALITALCVLTIWLLIPIIPLVIMWIGCMATTPSIHKKYLVQKGFDSEQVVVNPVG